MTRAAAGALLAAAAVGAAAGCAQPGSPPGGEVDRTPPRVVEVFPEAFDTLTDLRAPAVIRFDERISERLQDVSDWREAVLISPVTGPHRVDRKRRSLEIIPTDGWAPDRVYRVMVRPVFRDLFGNQRQEPIELVFSTGGPFHEGAMAGFVGDRITGQSVPEARVVAERRIDDARYVAVTDTGGFFAMRYLPAGAYDVEAWLDQDRDGEPDFFEMQDITETVFGVGDTVVVELALLPMDTTPARLARAEPVDTSKVRLVFDDYFAPGPVAGSARLFRTSDSSLVTSSGRLVHGSRLDSIQAAEAAAREALRAEQAARDSILAARDSVRTFVDSIAADVTGVDPARAVADTGADEGDRLREARRREPPDRRVQEDRPGQPGRRAAPGQQPAGDRQDPADRPPLPSRELILLLPGVLAPDTAYYVVVEGVENIRGVPGGGGTAPFRALPAPDTASADTVPADTVPPDTVPPDTVPPDTVAPDTVPPDTIPPDAVSPPDTVPVPASPAAGRRR